MTKKELQQLTKIAQKHIMALEHRADLESHLSDEADFFEVSIWDIKVALVAAYELGKNKKG